MLIKEIMNTSVCECTEDTTLAEAYELIQRCPNRFAVVLDSNMHRVPLGIVNEHSICEALVRDRRRDKQLFAGALMSTRVKKVLEDTDVRDCADLLSGGADAILVISAKRQFRGVVDLAMLSEAHKESLKAEKPRPWADLIGQAIPASVEIPAFGWLK